jgi:glycosyltransferase involved in cell wall biosynthesis
MNESIVWIRERFSWMGNHSGYDLVCDAISQRPNDGYHSIWREPGKPLPKGGYRFLNTLAASTQKSPYYDIHSTAAEFQVLWHSFWNSPRLVHLTYGEAQLGILPKFRQRYSFKLIATVHQPRSWWNLTYPHPERLTDLDALIVVASSAASYFEAYLPGRVFFIPHGVDTHFFHPKPTVSETAIAPPRCVFSGRWLRDIPTLSQVIDRVLEKNSHIQFDLIVPNDARHDPALFRIARHEQVTWYSNLTDEQLRSRYQSASLLLLPLLDCTANNALLEAISCGLPIVTNAVGGIPDYTAPSFTDILPVGDVEGMTEAVLQLVDSPTLQHERGQCARAFAEQYLNWETISNRTVEVYDKILHPNFAPALTYP